MSPSNEEWQRFIELQPIVEETAKKLAVFLRLTPLTKDEFLSGVNEKIQDTIHLYNPKMPFRGWCWTVLHNHGVTIIRQHAKKRRLIDELGRKVAGDQKAVARASCNRPESDNQPSFDVIATLERYSSGFDRVILGIDMRLLGTLEPERVAAWLDQAKLAAEFPWRELESIPKQADRRKAIAARFNHNDAWLRLRIKRALDRLREKLQSNPPDDGDGR